MSQTETRTAAQATPFAPPSPEARAALTAECIAAIISGRRMPEAACPRAWSAACPESVQAGIERIVRGPAS
jgi:hypothetical protein